MPRVFFLYQLRRRLIASSTSDAFANRSYFFFLSGSRCILAFRIDNDNIVLIYCCRSLI